MQLFTINPWKVFFENRKFYPNEFSTKCRVEMMEHWKGKNIQIRKFRIKETRIFFITEIYRRIWRARKASIEKVKILSGSFMTFFALHRILFVGFKSFIFRYVVKLCNADVIFFFAIWHLWKIEYYYSTPKVSYNKNIIGMNMIRYKKE